MSFSLSLTINSSVNIVELPYTSLYRLPGRASDLFFDARRLIPLFSFVSINCICPSSE